MFGKPGLILAAAMLGANAALAQQPSPKAQPAPNVGALPQSDARQPSATPPGTGPSGRSLSHQLSRPDGVPQPPATRNGDMLHPPSTGNDGMSVISPRRRQCSSEVTAAAERLITANPRLAVRR